MGKSGNVRHVTHCSQTPGSSHMMGDLLCITVGTSVRQKIRSILDSAGCLTLFRKWFNLITQYSQVLLDMTFICIWCFHTAGMWMLTPIHETDWQWTSLIFQEDIMDLLDKLDIPDNFCLDSRQSNTQECFFFWSLMTNSCQRPGALFWFFFP